MSTITHITIPSLVRVKAGAIDRLGIYLKRSGHLAVMLVTSQGMVPDYLRRVHTSLEENGIDCLETVEVADASFELATALLTRLPRKARAIVGLGGGKALDVAKYVAFLAGLPYYAAPTSLSNDGFSSPLRVKIGEADKRGKPGVINVSGLRLTCLEICAICTAFSKGFAGVW